MPINSPRRVALLYPGDVAARANPAPEASRFAPLFAAFAAAGVQAEPAIYDDSFVDEVKQQLLGVDGVLVWVNPLNGAHGRQLLDKMLREVEAHGVFVSTRPDIILKLGTKQVLVQTQSLGWGCETYQYNNAAQFQREFPLLLAAGKTRVLKQFRGNDGIGVWKVQCAETPVAGTSVSLATRLIVQHAKRGCVEERMTLSELFALCEIYFANGGMLIDQAYQARLPEGMVRCYLSHNKVAGFGHQTIVALHPAPVGGQPTDAPAPTTRQYHPPTQPEFQALKTSVEDVWLPALQALLGIAAEALPIIWDCDFLLGPKAADGTDTYVLGEINVSSVYPYPASAIPFIVAATVASLGKSL